MDINKLLKRAVDFRDLTQANDRLDALIGEVMNDELSEDDLGFVAAARNLPRQPIKADDNDKTSWE